MIREDKFLTSRDHHYQLFYPNGPRLGAISLVRSNDEKHFHTIFLIFVEKMKYYTGLQMVSGCSRRRAGA